MNNETNESCNVVFKCPHCGADITVPDSTEEYQIECPSCGKPVDLTECAENSGREGHASAPPPPLQEKTVRKVYPESAYSKPRLPLRSPASAWWSLAWPGIGHILFGQEKKGLFLATLPWILSVTIVGLFLLPVVWVIAIADGIMVGLRMREGGRIRDWEWFPSILEPDSNHKEPKS